MQLAFKIAQPNFFDTLISRWQWLRGFEHWKFSHVEIVFSDGMSFSASVMDKGVRFKEIHYSHPDEWVVVELKGFDEQRIRAKAEEIAGTGTSYGFFDIAFMLLLIPINLVNQWFCSEVIAYLLGFLRTHVTPAELYELILRYYEDTDD